MSNHHELQLRLERALTCVRVVVIVYFHDLVQRLSRLPAFEHDLGHCLDTTLGICVEFEFGGNRVYGVYAPRGGVGFAGASLGRVRVYNAAIERRGRVLGILIGSVRWGCAVFGLRLGQDRVERHANTSSLPASDHHANPHIERGRALRAAMRDLSAGAISYESAAALARAREQRDLDTATNRERESRWVLRDVGAALGAVRGDGARLGPRA